MSVCVCVRVRGRGPRRGGGWTARRAPHARRAAEASSSAQRTAAPLCESTARRGGSPALTRIADHDVAHHRVDHDQHLAVGHIEVSPPTNQPDQPGEEPDIGGKDEGEACAAAGQGRAQRDQLPADHTQNACRAYRAASRGTRACKAGRPLPPGARLHGSPPEQCEGWAAALAELPQAEREMRRAAGRVRCGACSSGEQVPLGVSLVNNVCKL